MTPSTPWPLAIVCLASLALVASACGSTNGGGPNTDAGCAEDSRVEPYEPGAEITGAQGLVLFRMGTLSPDPADVGDNAWNLSLEDASSGGALSGCTLEATPFMPDHNHGSNNPTATEASTAGDYEFTDISFIMAGYWEVTLNASCPALDGDDSLMVNFCVEG